MGVHAIFAADGLSASFYIVGVNCDAPPAGAVEIDEVTWQAFLAGGQRWDGAGLVAYVPPPPPPTVPDNPTLGDWRVGLVLWTRTDGTGAQVTRLSDVMAGVQKLVASGNPLGAVAQERLEYSNNVLRAQLLQLKDAFGFTEAEVDESLYRAHQVSLGDLTGVWPLPTA